MYGLPTPGPPASEARRLVIAYAFAPYADTSAIVAAKRVLAHGEPVDLIQNAMDDLRGRDDTLEQVAGDLVRRRSVLPTPTRFGGWRSIIAFCDAGIETIEEWERSGPGYDSVYSRAHFIASHYLAARYALRRPGVHWQAEFSDPLSRTALGEERAQTLAPHPFLDELRAGLEARGIAVPASDRVHVWGEYLALALADQIVFTNAAQRDYVLGLYDAPFADATARRSIVSPHPVPPARLYDAVPSVHRLSEETVNVGYFGNFYTSQQPGAVFDAAAALSSQDRERVRLHVFTGDVTRTHDLVEQAGAGDVVKVMPRVPYLEFLHLSTKMDVLLALDAASPAPDRRSPTLLSKWSDYSGSGTPVWGVVERGSQLDAQRLAYRSPLGHRTAALQVLTSLSRSGVVRAGVVQGAADQDSGETSLT